MASEKQIQYAKDLLNKFIAKSKTVRQYHETDEMFAEREAREQIYVEIVSGIKVTEETPSWAASELISALKGHIGGPDYFVKFTLKRNDKLANALGVKDLIDAAWSAESSDPAEVVALIKSLKG